MKPHPKYGPSEPRIIVEQVTAFVGVKDGTKVFTTGGDVHIGNTPEEFEAGMIQMVNQMQAQIAAQRSRQPLQVDGRMLRAPGA